MEFNIPTKLIYLVEEKEISIGEQIKGNSPVAMTVVEKKYDLFH